MFGNVTVLEQIHLTEAAASKMEYNVLSAE